MLPPDIRSDLYRCKYRIILKELDLYTDFIFGLKQLIATMNKLINRNDKTRSMRKTIIIQYMKLPWSAHIRDLINNIELTTFMFLYEYHFGLFFLLTVSVAIGYGTTMKTLMLLLLLSVVAMTFVHCEQGLSDLMIFSNF